MQNSSDTPMSFLDAVIAQYVDNGDIDEALAEAQRQVFQLVRDSGDGIPPFMMIEALELWVYWSLKVTAGTMAAIAAAAVPGWSEKRAEALGENMEQLFALLKEDAMRTVLTMRSDPDVDSPPDAG